MTASAGRGGGVWAVLAMLGIFVAAAAYYQHRASEVTDAGVASSFNARPQGDKAYYLLLQRLGYAEERLESPWTAIPARARVLVEIEPFERQVSATELPPLRQWVQRGGTLLYFVTGPARPLDPRDPVAGDVAVVRAQDTPDMATPVNTNAFTAGAAAVRVTSPVRLDPAAGSQYTMLLRDVNGAVAVEKPLGRGRVVVSADASALTNGAIGEADNAVFAVDLVTASASHGSEVVFDEYHHGIGFAAAGAGSGGGIWSATPAPVRLAVIHFLLLAALMLYNGNRALGAKLRIPQHGAPSSADYVASMARLLRAAGATDAPIAILRAALVRDASAAWSIAGNDDGKLAAVMAVRGDIAQSDAADVLARSASAAEARRHSQAEMVQLAAQMDDLRRRCGLVGPR